MRSATIVNALTAAKMTTRTAGIYLGQKRPPFSLFLIIIFSLLFVVVALFCLFLLF